jgi:hypothetical protein
LAYRLPGGRVTLEVDGYDGLQVEVEPIGAWPVFLHATALSSALFAAEDGSVEQLNALVTVYTHFLAEAQPTWQIVDHRGPVQTTVAGMLRLPVALGVGLASDWIERFAAAPPETAVDKLVPPGELRDELNAKLRAVA